MRSALPRRRPPHRGRMQPRTEQLRGLVESYLAELALTSELGTLEPAMRHALGGKRIRPVLLPRHGRCGRRTNGERCCRPQPPSSSCTRSRSSTTICRHSTTTGSGVARRRCGRTTARRPRSSPATRCSPRVSGSRSPIRHPRWPVSWSTATLAMIGGQQLDLEGGAPLERLHSLKTGALFSASVMCGLWAADVPVVRARAVAGVRRRARPAVPDRRRRARRGRLRARGGRGAVRAALADEAAERARARLADIEADTTVLEQIVGELAVRTA